MTEGPVLLIGLDASEWSLIRSLVDQGKLPTLAAMLADGRYGRLKSVAEHYAGGVWPTFYTGQDIPWHGVYHSKLWRQENMRCEMANSSWLPATPFWERKEAQGLRSCVIDMPMTVGAPATINGLQLSGWGTHDLLVTGASPGKLWRELRRQHGHPLMEAERFGPQDVDSLLGLCDNLKRSTQQSAEISVALLKRESWDFFCHVFGAPHRAGHYLWDQSQVEMRGVSRSTEEKLEHALEEMYRTCDDALARILDAAPSGSTAMIFAVHGMGKNRGWSDLCPDIFDRIQHGDKSGSPKKGLLYQLKRRLPVRKTEDVLAYLPLSLRHRLVPLWSARMYDWRKTRYFPVPMDQAGYLRLNVVGREPGGIVDSGSEYDELCAELTEAITSWQDMDSGVPIVQAVHPAYSDAPGTAPFRGRLPDLVITWSDHSALSSRGIRSDKFGELLFSAPGRVPSGRSGNHTGYGWFVMTGPGVEPGEIQDAHILDLAPTVLSRLGMVAFRDMQGRRIPGC